MTDWVNKNTIGHGFYEPVRFNGFPEIKESVLAGHLPATFMVAPLAIKLRQDGAPIKIVYLGHRDGTALMVHKESNVREIADLRGKLVAIPTRFSNQYLITYKALRERGLSFGKVGEGKDVSYCEMPPPDMPTALFARAVDAIIAGEPFMAQTELDDYGRVLFQAKEVWPNFISCVLVVHEDAIRSQPELVQRLVDGIAASGKWLDADMNHRMSAALEVAQNKQYYNQDRRLLRFVLSKPPDRVTYSRLMLARSEFDQIVKLGVESGVLKSPIAFEEFAETRFSDRTQDTKGYTWRGPADSP